MMISDIVWMVVLFLIPGMAAFTVYRYIAGYAIDKLYNLFFIVRCGHFCPMGLPNAL